MGRRRSAWLGLAGWLVAGCTYTAYPAESTAAACINNEDDDRDGRKNCDDPDCWHMAYCQPSYDGGLPPLGPPNLPDQIPTIPDDPLVPPVGNHSMTDASTPIDVPMTDARTPDAPEDANIDSELPMVCSKYCPTDECNEDGSCNKPLVFGEYNVQAIALSAPRAANNNCFDLRPLCTWVLGATCCAPDPIVTLYVGETKAGFAPAIKDNDSPVWASIDMKIELREGDRVTFEVEDEDTEAVDDPTDLDPQPMFSCEAFVTAEMIEMGKIGCAPEGSFQPDREDPYHVVASITRLGDVSEDDDGEGDLP